METGLKTLELTLSEDEMERHLLNSSGDEHLLNVNPGSVSALSEADLLILNNLKICKNLRNRERARRLKLSNHKSSGVKTTRAGPSGSLGFPTLPKGSETKIEGTGSTGVKPIRAGPSGSLSIPTLPKGSEKKIIRTGITSIKPVRVEPSSSLADPTLPKGSEGERTCSTSVETVRAGPSSSSTIPTRPKGSEKNGERTGSKKIYADRINTADIDNAGIGTNSKRNRSNNSLLVEPKKQRMAESYCDTAKETLIMLIRCEEGPVTVDQAAAIRKILYACLDKIENDSNFPMFESCKLIDGIYVIVCINDITFKWLIDCLSTIITETGFLLKYNSKAQEVPKRKVVVYLPDPDQVETLLLFKRLKGPNRNLDTTSWTLLRDLGVSLKGRTLVFAVDLASVQYILSKNCSLFYMMQKIYVEIRAPYEPNYRLSRQISTGTCPNNAGMDLV
ncbi:unnamed protein product [Diamesa serratosioi]